MFGSSKIFVALEKSYFLLTHKSLTLAAVVLHIFLSTFNMTRPGLTWLADEKTHIISEDRCAAVKEITSQLHHDWELRQFLQHLAGLREEEEFCAHIVF